MCCSMFTVPIIIIIQRMLHRKKAGGGGGSLIEITEAMITVGETIMKSHNLT